MYFPCLPLLFFEASLNPSEVGAAQAGLKHKPASLSDGSECSEGGNTAHGQFPGHLVVCGRFRTFSTQ